MFKHYLKSTIEYIIDNANASIRKHFSLCLIFSILSCICSVIWGLIYMYVCYEVYDNVGISQSFSKFLSDIWYREELTFFMIPGLILVLNIALYSSFLISSINDPELKQRTKYSFGDLKKYITDSEFIKVFIMQAMVIFLYFLTYRSFHYLFEKWHWINNEYKLRDIATPQRGFVSWLDGCVIMIKGMVVYLAAILFVLSIYEGNINGYKLRKYKYAIYASFLISLAVNLMFNYTMKLYDVFVDSLFYALPSSGNFNLLSWAFYAVVYLVLFSMYTWVLACAFCLPIKTQYDSAFEKESGIEEYLTDIKNE
jgi:hypothetical protein